ncbi:metallophosphoesterase [Campylobacter concisus]
MSEQIYIIGDVHGCFNTLLELIKQFPNKEKSQICFVGDVIDRGFLVATWSSLSCKMTIKW